MAPGEPTPLRAAVPTPPAGLASRLDAFLLDLRFAARALRRTPGFTIVAIASLAVGLALTTATLTVVNAYLLRALPAPHADRLYRVHYAPVGHPEPHGLSDFDWTTLRDFIELADSSTFSTLFFSEPGAPDSDSTDAMGLAVARGSAEGLGARAILGRSLQDYDYRPDAERVIVIGHSLWRTRFGSDPAVIGRSLRGRPSFASDTMDAYRIVGVLPPGFGYARGYQRGPAEFVVPLRRPLRVYLVRLREGIPVADAERRLTEVVRREASLLPPQWQGIRLESIRDAYVSDLRPMLYALTVAVILVLGIVCANVAVLVLLRAMRRQKEMSVRVSLGAGRWHIARMLAAEAGLICGAALAAGLVLIALTLPALAPLVEEYLGKPVPGGTSALTIDPLVLSGVGGVGALLALSLAGIPLLAPWQRMLAETLRRESRGGTDGPSMRRLRAALIAIEVAGSLALLVGCGLMIRSVVHLMRTDLGYDTHNVLRVRVALPVTYPDETTFLRFHDRFIERLSASSMGPFALANFIGLYPAPEQGVETMAGGGDEGTAAKAGLLAVSDGYFSLMRIPVRQGRAFTADDRPGAEPVAIVSETLARRLWPEAWREGRVLGQRLRTADQPVPRSPLTVWRTIVGVVRDVRQTHTDTDLHDVYVPFLQAPSRYAPLYVRTDRPLSLWLTQVQAIGASIDPKVQISGAASFEAQADALLKEPRFVMSTLTAFATFAALLAMLGIYGVTAYAVEQRRREVAIRMALGATGRTVVRMFLTDGGRTIAIGLACGLLAATAGSRLIEHQLHGVRPFDLPTLAATCGLMTIAGLLAIWWPATRAAARNPVTSLNEP